MGILTAKVAWFEFKPRHEKTGFLPKRKQICIAQAKTNTQISCAVTAQTISEPANHPIYM